MITCADLPPTLSYRMWTVSMGGHPRPRASISGLESRDNGMTPGVEVDVRSGCSGRIGQRQTPPSEIPQPGRVAEDLNDAVADLNDDGSSLSRCDNTSLGVIARYGASPHSPIQSRRDRPLGGGVGSR